MADRPNPNQSDADRQVSSLAKRVDRRLDAVHAEREEIEQWLAGTGAWVMLAVAVGVGVLILLSLVGVHI